MKGKHEDEFNGIIEELRRVVTEALQNISSYDDDDDQVRFSTTLSKK
jgi:hypothetical protein